jgi:hypothetical protein
VLLSSVARRRAGLRRKPQFGRNCKRDRAVRR